MKELEEHLLEEIEFWERFVSEWNTERKGPLPKKARDSLAYAQYKMDRYLTELELTRSTTERTQDMQKNH